MVAEVEKFIEEQTQMPHGGRADVGASSTAADRSDKAETAQEKTEKEQTDSSRMAIWRRIQMARHQNRPYALDYLGDIFSNFQELHGDRLFADDHAIIGGTAFLGGIATMVIAQQKGRTTKEKIFHNFGSPNPEGYRKALRLMRLAARFRLPIIALIDTAGAYPGIGAEERHVAEAIAVNLREMTSMGTPIISVVIGEGGSGGALGIAVSDRVLILENAYYSVISPEGCAAILWKDSAKAPEAAEALCLSPEKLLELGIVEEVIKEPPGGAHNDHRATSQALGEALGRHLRELLEIKSIDKLLSARYDRFRRFGVFAESDGEILE
ncbi:MAG: acetyl-CoA carboxylase carboxyltransferase subunit alpha [Puniceicoccales bacterium]|jgi:acetyl-CoA carboxylase carboxyl transferase subunit alpha|nr:acetyl-CoA carboxylase carboxyltransferase subunit alpha [Puniceicoccales bacterium]